MAALLDRSVIGDLVVDSGVCGDDGDGSLPDWECTVCCFVNWGWWPHCENCDAAPPPPPVGLQPTVRPLETPPQAASPAAPSVERLIEEINALKRELRDLDSGKKKRKKKALKDKTNELRSSLLLRQKNRKKPGGRKQEPWEKGVPPVIVMEERKSRDKGLPLIPPGFDLDRELDAMVGLPSFKRGIRSIATQLKAHQRRVQRGLTQRDGLATMCHMLMLGNPGTGKTTAARLVTRLLYHVGYLKESRLVEVGAKDLIAGHCGQTAMKTAEVCSKAVGGVLFVDEAYSINPKGDSSFGRECVDTLVKEMEDHREKLVVIMAGYPNAMDTFLSTNEGLRSRFNEKFTFTFEDYSVPELAMIFLHELHARDYVLEASTQDKLDDIITGVTKEDDRRMQNGRLMRTLVENCIANQNERWVDMEDDDVTDELMVTVTDVDFPQPNVPL